MGILDIMHSPPLRKAVTDKRVVSCCCRWAQSPNNVILIIIIIIIIIIITIIIVVLITHFAYICLNAFTKMSKMLLINGTNKLSIFI